MGKRLQFFFFVLISSFLLIKSAIAQPPPPAVFSSNIWTDALVVIAIAGFGVFRLFSLIRKK